jgi:CHAT domain-containing protein
MRIGLVLSECNTIAGEKPGAEGLSGLARAYAAARVLLVSHWAVHSNAAMRLTTSTLDTMISDPTRISTTALIRAMLIQHFGRRSLSLDRGAAAVIAALR